MNTENLSDRVRAVYEQFEDAVDAKKAFEVFEGDYQTLTRDEKRELLTSEDFNVWVGISGAIEMLQDCLKALTKNQINPAEVLDDYLYAPYTALHIMREYVTLTKDDEDLWEYISNAVGDMNDRDFKSPEKVIGTILGAYYTHHTVSASYTLDNVRNPFKVAKEKFADIASQNIRRAAIRRLAPGKKL